MLLRVCTCVRIVAFATVIVITTAATARAQAPPPTDGWVVLTVDDYRVLRARAFPSTPDPLPPPVEATLTRIDYELRVTGDTVTGEARLTIDVLKQGWVSIRLPQGMLVRGARIDGRTTALVDETPPRVLIARAGRSLLTLDIVMPVEGSGGRESMTLPPSASALSAVTLIVPRAGVDLSVDGGFVAEHTEAAAESRWQVYGSPARPLTFTWKRKVDDRRQSLPLRARARITELVALGEESSHVTASVRVEVVQGVTRDLVLATPDGIAVNNVTGATVADWRHDAGTLTITLLEPLTGSAAIVITADVRTPRDGTIAIPIVRMPAAERETGGVAVDVVGAGEITAQQPRGFDPADVSDLGDIVEGRESPAMVAFGFRPLPGTAPRTLSVTVSRYTAQAVLVANVEEARYDVLATEDGKLLVRARYAVRNNQRAFLGVTLPPQSVLWSAALAGRPVRPGRAPAGGFLMPLQKGRTGENAPTFAVELVYLQRLPAWSDKGDARLELPAVDLPVSRTGLLVHYSPRFEVESKPGVFRSEVDTGPWASVLRTDAPMPPPPPPAAPPKLSAAEVVGGVAGGERDHASMQALMDRLRKDTGRSAVGVIPVEVAVPAIGPSIFAAAELTAESQAPAIDLHFKRVGDK